VTLDGETMDAHAVAVATWNANGRQGPRPRRGRGSVRGRPSLVRDIDVSEVVSAYPTGADREAVGEALGVTREAVRLIEREAIRWLAVGLLLDLWATGTRVSDLFTEPTASNFWDSWGEP
jgi:DNA-binding XRE family transcriptional regulator